MGCGVGWWVASYWQEVITSPSIRSKNGKTKLVHGRVGLGMVSGVRSGGWGWDGVGGRGVTDREKAATVGGKMLWWMAVPFPVCVMASCSVMSCWIIDSRYGTKG